MSFIETDKYKIRLAIEAYKKNVFKKFEEDKEEAIQYRLKCMERSYRFWHKNIFGVKFPTREDAIRESNIESWDFTIIKQFSLANVKRLEHLSQIGECIETKIYISSDDAWILNWIPK